MKALRKYLSLITLELKKTRRRGIWLVPAALLLLVTAWLAYALRGARYLEHGWRAMLYNVPLLNAVLVPTAIAVFASRSIDMEHKGGTWKVLETVQRKSELFIGKVLYGLCGVLLFAVSETAVLLAVGKALGFYGKPDLWAYALFFSQTLAITFNLYLLQMLLAVLFRNQAVTLCTGLCGSMAGLFLMFMPQWGLLRCLIPYGQFGASMFVGMDWSYEEQKLHGFYYLNQKNGAEFFIAVWFIVLIVVGWKLFARMDTDGLQLCGFAKRAKKSAHTPICVSRLPVELIKLRRTPIWLAFLILPLISAVIGTGNYLGNIDILTSTWNSLWTQHTLFFCYLFMPPLIGVYAACLWRLEHSGTNWNMVMTNVSAWRLVFQKLAVCAGVTLLTLLWVALLFLLCGRYAGILDPVPLALLDWLVFGFLGGVSVCAAQCFLSLVIRSFAVPIGLALAGGVAGLAATAKNGYFLLPYSIFSVGMRANNPDRALNRVGFTAAALIFTVAFYLLSVFYIKKKDVKTQE